MPQDVVESLDFGSKKAGSYCIKGTFETDINQWSDINSHFHGSIVGAADSRVVADAISRNNHLPFAAADSIIIDSEDLGREFKKLQLAQFHHELIFQSLKSGEGARAEMLMREHALIGLRYPELLADNL